MSEWNYIATAQEPTAVIQARGPLRLTAQEPCDFVVAFATRLEVYRTEAEGRIVLQCKFPVNGRVALLEAVPGDKPQTRDRLFVFTEKWQLAILGFDVAAGELALLAMGHLQWEPSRRLDDPPLCACDPRGHLVVVHAQTLRLSVAALHGVEDAAPGSQVLDLCEQGQIFSTDLAEQKLLDLAFLEDSGQGSPSLITLHVDCHGARAIAMWHVDTKAHCVRERKAGSMGTTRVATMAAQRLVPVPLPLGGVMVVGSSILAYHDGSGLCTGSITGGPACITAVTRVASTGWGWLVGGSDGSLWQVHLKAELGDGMPSGMSPALSVERLGVTSPPSCLVSLSSFRAFVGSMLGDSQVVHISSRSDTSDRVLVEASWTNLAPIVDFCIAEPNGRGQRQIATCSGIGSTGSLRLVRVGVGVTEFAMADGFAGVMGMWVVHIGSPPCPNLQLLVLSFLGRSRVFAMQGDCLEFTEERASGLLHHEETLLCSEFLGCVVQVTASGVHSMSPTLRTCMGSWSTPTGARVLTASVGVCGVFVGMSTGHVFQLKRPDHSPASFEIHAQWSLGADPACLHACGSLCAIGLWTPELCLLWPQCPSKISRHSLPNESVPRSVAVRHSRAGMHVLVGMGNGWLMTFGVNDMTGELSQQKVICLGTTALRLLCLSAGPDVGDNILVTGARPTIIHESAHGQCVYTTVNLPQVCHATHLHIGECPSCLAFVADDKLVIGALEDIQKVHVLTVPLGQSPSCVCWHGSTRIFAVGCEPEQEPDTCSRMALASSSTCPPAREIAHASLRLIHGDTQEIVESKQMQPHERIGSVCCFVCAEDPVEYLMVGTAFVHSHEPEPFRGRLLCCKLQNPQTGELSVNVIHTQEVPGAVYALANFKGMLVGAVNNRVVIWQFSNGSGFKEVCSHCNGYTLVRHIRCVGDRIFVGDMMRSASLLLYRADKQSLEELARDSDMRWVSALEAFGSDSCMFTDDHNNLFVSACRAAQDQASEPVRLEPVAKVHLGEHVNRLHRAALTDAPTGKSQPREQVVWGSIDGSLGVVARLTNEEFKRLSSIQELMAQRKAGRTLDHDMWRALPGESEVASPHCGVVDGDLVEDVLRLSSSDQEALLGSAASMHEEGVAGLLHEVEDLSRLH